MAEERTLALVKPDGVMKGVVEEIKQRYLDAGLIIVREHRLKLDMSQAQDLYYPEHDGRFYWEGLWLSIFSGPVHLLELEGPNAIAIVRALNGATDPTKAAPGTIRYDFRSAGGPFNTVHGSDSVESYRREIQILTRML